RRRHTRFSRDWSSDVCSSDLKISACIIRFSPHLQIMTKIPFSILDLSPIAEGSDAAESFRHTLDIAQHAERWGYKRYWMAEHHRSEERRVGKECRSREGTAQ